MLFKDADVERKFFQRFLFDDENDDDRKGVSVRLVFFFVATKEEDEEGGTIERFVTFVYGFVQRHSSLSFSLSLSFSVSLSLWNDGTDF